jgi:hypothetical protein
MQTFCAVNDQLLINGIRSATSRIVLIAPGIYLPVAQALGERFNELPDLDVTVVLDHSDEVCRLGYGDLAGLECLQTHARQKGFWLRSQPGLRVGVLLVDDETLIWSPTPQSIESPAGEAEDDLLSPSALMTNGLMIGSEPLRQICRAVVAEGENLNPNEAEIGLNAITPDDVAQTKSALQRNPAVPVDLQRITRVYSNKLQFVELKVRNAKLSRSQFSLSSDLLNADAKDEIKGLLESKLRAFADLRDEPIQVPVFIDGEQAFNGSGQPLLAGMTEASLESIRRDIERKYTYDIPGFGRLIAKDERQEFEKQIAAYQKQLEAHSLGVKELLDKQGENIVAEAVALIQGRLKSANKETIPTETLKQMINKGMDRAKQDEPGISMVFKDITYEQTQSQDFLTKVQKALPAGKRKQLGAITEHSQAALVRTQQLEPHQP